MLAWCAVLCDWNANGLGGNGEKEKTANTYDDSNCDVIVDVVEKNRLLLKWKFFWPFRKRCCCVVGLEMVALN